MREKQFPYALCQNFYTNDKKKECPLRDWYEGEMKKKRKIWV